MSKSNTSKNALSHGAYSNQVVLPWENEQDFNKLHEELRDEFLPDGRTEEEAVFDLACLHWKKRRLNMGSRLPFLRDREMSALRDAAVRDGWEGIADHFAELLDAQESTRDTMRYVNKEFHKAVAIMHEVMTKYMQQKLAPQGADEKSEAMEQISPPDASNPEDKRSTTDVLQELLPIMNDVRVLNTAITPNFLRFEKFCLDERPCERAYRPDLMERDLKIHAEIDKRIEKCITRLTVLKTYKEIHGLKEVKAQSAAVIALPAKKPSK
jgi:hypothetical protein